MGSLGLFGGATIRGGGPAGSDIEAFAARVGWPGLRRMRAKKRVTARKLTLAALKKQLRRME